IEDWNCVVETDESGNTVSYCGDAVSSAETSVTVGGAITEVTGNIILKTKNFFSKITSLDSSTTGAFSSEITGAFDFKKCIENVKQKAGEVTDKVKKKVEEYSEGLKQTKLKIGDYYTDTERELYPGTLKSIEIEGAKCKTCAYYEIKGLDTDGEKKITYIISIDEKSVSGIFEEDEFFSDGPSVTTFNEYEEQALGLKPPVYEGDMSELEERIGEPPDLELYSNGVWYLKDGTIWQAKGDGTVECTNCNDEEEAKHKSFFEK
ncbi:MAG: hypothetical protein L6408_02165, partial [Nanoarchaeota archaeon]|nr:hypothetical protein [Nanoarchaeota archaeon]